MNRKPAVEFVVAVSRLERVAPVDEEDFKRATDSFNQLMQTLPSGRRMRLAGDIARTLMAAIIDGCWVSK